MNANFLLSKICLYCFMMKTYIIYIFKIKRFIFIIWQTALIQDKVVNFIILLAQQGQLTSLEAHQKINSL